MTASVLSMSCARWLGVDMSTSLASFASHRLSRSCSRTNPFCTESVTYGIAPLISRWSSNTNDKVFSVSSFFSRAKRF